MPLMVNDTAIVLGAGFSKAAGLPKTDELTDHFVSLAATRATKRAMQQRISKHLDRFWRDIFGYDGVNNQPTFEDHFTLLDLTANTGHNLGPHYTPAKLRAIRRLSIHRVFDIIDRFADAAIRKPSTERRAAEAFVGAAASDRSNCFITTNWDVVVESMLFRRPLPYHYAIPVHTRGGCPWESDGVEILKLQGSSNWAYCDSCRRLFAKEHPDKTLLHSWAFLEERDFYALEPEAPTTKRPIKHPKDGANDCSCCGARLTARVATFSYSKSYNFQQFHATWERALQRLRDASHWLFIGYSLPEADFEIRQMLKVAQMASITKPTVTLVTKDDDAAIARFRRFFGVRLTMLHTTGFEAFAKTLL